MLALSNFSYAQVIDDGSLSTNVSSSDDLNFTISGGKQVGGNLFHSFREFSIPRGGAAFFNNNPDIQNIISRVTGGSPSMIEGLIKAGHSANLFLINPSGIIFGPDAKLEIGGSFIASTANQIDFSDGISFSASNTQSEPLLTVSIPIGLRFGQNAGSITNKSQALVFRPEFGEEVPTGLAVQPGRTLALLGNGVFLEGGGLYAPGGRVEISSVGELSFVSINLDKKGWAFGYSDIQNFQNIILSKSIITANGMSSGAINLRGKKIKLSGTTIGSFTDAEPGEPIFLFASESVEMADESFLLNETVGNGKAGDITIVTKNLKVSGASQVLTRSYGDGAGGNLTVNATQSVEVKGGESLSRLGTQTLGKGNAGNLRIDTDKLIISEGGQISTSTFDAGNAGDLIINASNSVTASGRNTNGLLASGLFSQTSGNTATGNAGTLKINTKHLVVNGGARISVGTVNGSKGQGGELQIFASEVEVSGGYTNVYGEFTPSSLLAGSEGLGDAGDLKIKADKLTVRDGAEVTVSALGGGSSGDLEIYVHTLFLDNQGSLKAETASGMGNILIQANNIILRRNSQISTNATGEASGGDINISTGILAALENSDITANSEGNFGGNVNINAAGIFRSPDSDITATSAAGPQFSGTVNINNTATDPNQGLIELPTSVVDPNTLVAQNACKRGSESEFTSSGRGGLPTNPNQDLSNGSVQVGLVEPASVETKAQTQNQSTTVSVTPQQSTAKTIAPAQGWVYNEKGEIVLVAYNPNVTSPQRLKDNTGCAAQ